MSPSLPVLLVVAAAVIRCEDRSIFLTQRPAHKPMAGRWEFPGGKIEKNETPEQALIREIQEEIGIILTPQDLTPLTFISHSYSSFHLLMPLYSCLTWSGIPHGREGQATEWVPIAALENFPLLDADRALIPPLKRLALEL